LCGKLQLPNQAISNLPPSVDKFSKISKFLGDRKWVAGETLTYADFFVYDVLDMHKQIFLPKHLEAFPNLLEYLDRFEALPGVKEYLASDKFQRLPIFSVYSFLANSADYKPTE